MGMYTGLRGRVKLKSQEIIDALIDCDFNWKCVGDILKNEIIKEYSGVIRCNMIPLGSICYIPWDKENTIENGIWTFSCSLKNYEGTIKNFIDNVLPEIAIAWDLESLYEECDTPIKYKHNSEKMRGGERN